MHFDSPGHGKNKASSRAGNAVANGPARRGKRQGERLFQCRLALDLAADIADDPAQPAAQDTQLPPMPPELFGMGVAARHHRGALGDPQVGLPQPHAAPARQQFSPRIAACNSLASVGKVIAFGCTAVSTVTRLRSWPRNAPAVRHPQAVGQEQLELVAEPLAPVA